MRKIKIRVTAIAESIIAAHPDLAHSYVTDGAAQQRRNPDGSPRRLTMDACEQWKTLLTIIGNTIQRCSHNDIRQIIAAEPPGMQAFSNDAAVALPRSTGALGHRRRNAVQALCAEIYRLESEQIAIENTSHR